MKELPRIGERTVIFARVLDTLAGGGDEVVASDDVIVDLALELVSVPWKVPQQALRDSLALLERMGALSHQRRRRGPRRPEQDTRTIQLQRTHWFWSLLDAEKVAEVAS